MGFPDSPASYMRAQLLLVADPVSEAQKEATACQLVLTEVLYGADGVAWAAVASLLHKLVACALKCMPMTVPAAIPCRFQHTGSIQLQQTCMCGLRTPPHQQGDVRAAARRACAGCCSSASRLMRGRCRRSQQSPRSA